MYRVRKPKRTPKNNAILIVLLIKTRPQIFISVVLYVILDYKVRFSFFIPITTWLPAISHNNSYFDLNYSCI